MSYALTILGPPRTKKTSNRIVILKRGRQKARRIMLPSKAWESWASDAIKLIMVQMRLDRREQLPDRPYNCAALFFRDKRIGDAVGFYQGLADVLEKAGVISNDKWLVQWDGSRLLHDKLNPRVELILTEVAA